MIKPSQDLFCFDLFHRFVLLLVLEVCLLVACSKEGGCGGRKKGWERELE